MRSTSFSNSRCPMPPAITPTDAVQPHMETVVHHVFVDDLFQ